MNDKYRDQWERLGQDDPYWAVLTDPNQKGNRWDKDEFFRSGEREISAVLKKITLHGAEVDLDVALDFGCGLGRLSRALASRFSKVLAVDLASSMLEEASRVNAHFSNIEYLHNTASHLQIVPDNSISFVYSNIVLQHMPRSSQVIFIREFCRVLKPNGILVFQTPSHCNLKAWRGWVQWLVGNSILNQIRKIKYGTEGVMELHTLSRSKVQEILVQQGMSPIIEESYESAGSSFESYMYYYRKVLKAPITS